MLAILIASMASRRETASCEIYLAAEAAEGGKMKKKVLIGVEVERWAQSPVVSNFRPYPVETEKIVLIFLDGAILTVFEETDGTRDLSWEWSVGKRPFSYRPKNGPVRVVIEEELGPSERCLRVINDSSSETVLWVSGQESFLDGALFEKTARVMEKRPVWIFAGASGLGKSTLGMLLASQGKIVYETDANKELPELIMADIIVAGNRHKDLTMKELYKHLPEDVNPILVEFSSAKEIM